MSDTRSAVIAVRDEVAKVVVGQDGAVSGLIAALLVRGHVLLEGVPGTAKTLMVTALAGALDLKQTRVQFTPDLMPSDVLGQSVYDADATSLAEAFRFREGPVFTNQLLADEINRTPPRTQAALLEAMEERRVTVEGTPRDLPDPFLVVATQNPVEYEGTYPLPEAQLDRFMFSLDLGYPERADEIEIVRRTTIGEVSQISPVVTREDILDIQKLVRAMPVADHVLAYAVDLASATRPKQAGTGKITGTYI